jgi:hypothetical protein
MLSANSETDRLPRQLRILHKVTKIEDGIESYNPHEGGTCRRYPVAHFLRGR